MGAQGRVMPTGCVALRGLRLVKAGVRLARSWSKAVVKLVYGCPKAGLRLV